MASVDEKAAKQFGETTECSICMSVFNDPRMLPCIHTFCFECLKHTAEAGQKNPGDRMNCPLCRRDFIIPADGMNGLQKNFFMEKFLEFKTKLQSVSAIVICDMCNVRNEGETGDMPKATMRCFECHDNYCDSCVKVHQFQKLSRNHQLVEIGSDNASEVKRPCAAINCTEHPQKALDYYCADCKKIVCVSCFFENHALHKCKDVTKVDKEFRQAIQKKLFKVSTYANEMLSLKEKAEIRKADFQNEIVDKEKAIHKRNQELKDMIDDHTQSLLNELSLIESKHVKEMETGMEDIDKYITIFRSFEAYSTELISKGSASDICSSVEQLIDRVSELEEDYETFIGRPHQSVEVSFQTTDLREALQKSGNLLGQIKETTSQFENLAIVMMSKEGFGLTKSIVKINLHRPNEISTQEHVPVEVWPHVYATVYCNTMYVVGLGDTVDEIWKFNMDSGWMKCVSLIQGRCYPSAAFIDQVLYICGGFEKSSINLLDSVEAFNAVKRDCQTVGKLLHGVWAAGNCVPFRSSLYIFGGKDKYHGDVSHVQVYDTKKNTCTLLTIPMPRPSSMIQAAVCETSAILVGQETCFIFDFEEETWQAREQFKAGVENFGLVLANGRVFIIGGGIYEKDLYGISQLKYRDDVRYVPLRNIIDDKPIEWKIHAKLPISSAQYSVATMRILV